MLPFASVDDYETTFGSSTPRTPDDLLSVSAEIRRYARWAIWPQETVTDLVVDGPGTPVIRLPTSLLTDVTALSEIPRGLHQSARDILLDELEWSAIGHIRHATRRCWTDRNRGITVSFVHGYTEVPADLKAFTLAQAKRRPTTASNLLQATVGSRSETFRGEVTAAEQTLLDSFRRF